MIANQSLLLLHLKTLFPGKEIHVNAMKNIDVKSPSSDFYMEYDIWIPEHNICFEFQDSYHYTPTWYFHNTQHEIQQKDNIKKELAREKGMDLIAIPCWWQMDLVSVAAAIRFQRPDLNTYLPETEINPPYLNPSCHFFKTTEMPDVGELMLASFIHPKLIPNISQHLWWIGEKYDGIRCFWNSMLRKAYTRYGREVELSSNILELFPPIFIDGELWFGRSRYSQSFSLVKSTNASDCSMLRMMAFDSPAFDLRGSQFELRYNSLYTYVNMHHPFTMIVPRMACESSCLDGLVQQIIEDGGEGVILQKYSSMYERGRSASVLKIKSSQMDQEGIVVAISDHSYQLKLPAGETILVPKENTSISNLSLGDIVTFSFELNSRRDVLVHPTIIRIRTDLSWEDLLRTRTEVAEARTNTSWKDNSGSNNTVGPEGRTKTAEEEYFIRTWLNDFLAHLQHENKTGDKMISDEETLRRRMEEYARGKGSHSRIGLAKLLANFKGYMQLLQRLFPEYKSHGGELHKVSWLKIETRRRFLEDIANDIGFDPQEASNWYTISQERVLSYKSAGTVLSYHGNSLAQAIQDLFPDIGVDKTKLQDRTLLWNREEARRKFFEDYATENGFDPLVPKNWYKQARDKIMAAKEAVMVLYYHSNSITQALLDLFPNIGLVKSMFPARPNYWYKIENRRRFFEDFARDGGFDPLLPDNWYRNVSTLRAKSSALVLSYHNNSIGQALADLFPTIGLDASKFHSSKTNRKQFFENYATENIFDAHVAENWYLQPQERIMAQKGADSVIEYHQNNVSQALIELFPDIGLDQSQFQPTHVFWSKEANRRQFFERYAQENQFDACNSEKWLLQSRQKIMATPGASMVLYYHSNSVSKALLDLFPDIGLAKSKFQVRQNFWSRPENRRSFFETYAKDNNFHVTSAYHWYSQPASRVLSSKGAYRVLHYHGSSIARALTELFPEVVFEKQKFIANKPFKELKAGILNTQGASRSSSIIHQQQIQF